MANKILYILLMLVIFYSDLIAMDDKPDENITILELDCRDSKTTSTNNCLQLQTYPSQVADDESQVKIGIDDNKTICIEEERRPVEMGLTIPPVAQGHEETYGRFLRGVLIYRPNRESDEGRIDMPIAALANPLEGTFDLSHCGDAWKHLSISTGYRKEKKPENVGKKEIWLAPRFLIEKELNTTAKHFQPIFGNWKETAEVGIFWTRGGDEGSTSYCYTTRVNMDVLSRSNLYNVWAIREDYLQPPRGGKRVGDLIYPSRFSCSFSELSATDKYGADTQEETQRPYKKRRIAPYEEKEEISQPDDLTSSISLSQKRKATQLKQGENFFSNIPIGIQTQLPLNVMFHLFLFLDQRDFWRASLVCRQWRAAAYEAPKSRLLDLSASERKKLDRRDCQALLYVPFHELILQGNGLGKQEALILAQAAWFKALNLSAKRNKIRESLSSISFNQIGAEGARALANGNLTALTNLSLSNNNIGDEGARALANGNLAALTNLSLNYNQIGAEGARALANGNLTALTNLDLGSKPIRGEGTITEWSSNKIGAEGARALANGNLTALTNLRLSYNQIGDEGARALANGNLTALTNLSLSYNSLSYHNVRDNHIGAEGARALANGNLTALTNLSLNHNKIGVEGARAIANGNLTALTNLHLSSNLITAEGARALANGNLTNLTSLNVSENFIFYQGIEAIANGNLVALKSLNLGRNYPGSEGAEAIANGNLTALTNLDLSNSSIRAKGARAIANGNLTALTNLNLSNTAIGDEGAIAISTIAISNGKLTVLTKLNLESNSIKNGTKEYLKTIASTKGVQLYL